jgi:hypothetical protein
MPATKKKLTSKLYNKRRKEGIPRFNINTFACQHRILILIRIRVKINYKVIGRYIVRMVVKPSYQSHKKLLIIDSSCITLLSFVFFYQKRFDELRITINVQLRRSIIIFVTVNDPSNIPLCAFAIP